MASVPTKVFPLARTEAGVPLAGVPGVPHVAHEVATKAEAEALEATGAFTTNARHPDRLDGDDDTDETPEPSRRTVSPKRTTEPTGPEPASNEPAPAGIEE